MTEIEGGGDCGRCGRSPAAGSASCYNSAHGEVWLCHPDDPALPDCYSLHNRDEAFGRLGGPR